MSLRRPSAYDRDVVEALKRLPDGDHSLSVRPDHLAPLKAEGSLHIWLTNGKLISIFPARNDEPREIL